MRIIKTASLTIESGEAEELWDKVEGVKDDMGRDDYAGRQDFIKFIEGLMTEAYECGLAAGNL